MIVFILTILLLTVMLHFYFKSITYTFNDNSIDIYYGIFTKKKKIIKKNNIIWKTVVKIGDHVLITVLHTAGGRVILFADAKNL